MGIRDLLRKKQNQETIEAVKRHIVHSQESVFRAIQELNRPVNGLVIARYMGIDSASVTPRLPELVKKGRIKIAYRKRGLDGKWRSFYEVKAVK